MTPVLRPWSNSPPFPSRPSRPTSPSTPPGSPPADSSAGTTTSGARNSKREWVKLHAMTGVRTNIVTAVEMSGWRPRHQLLPPDARHDCRELHPRGRDADKAYSSKANLQAVATLGGTPYIPFKGQTIPRCQRSTRMHRHRGVAWTGCTTCSPTSGTRSWPTTTSGRNVETTFSMIKRKFGDSLRSKSDVGQMNEVLCKVIAHNLCVLIACIHEIGLDVPEFSGNPALRAG